MQGGNACLYVCGCMIIPMQDNALTADALYTSFSTIKRNGIKNDVQSQNTAIIWLR